MKYFIASIVLAFGISANCFAQQKAFSDAIPVYYPVNEKNIPTAYIGVPFKVNGEYENRDGDYKVELRICDTNNICIGKLFVGPYAQFTSTSADDAGKDIEITTFFRAKNSGAWKRLRTDHAKIAPAPLVVVMPAKILPHEGEHIQAYYGIEGYSSPPGSDFLEVESEGYFESEAVINPKSVPSGEGKKLEPLHEEMAPLAAEYILKPTDRYNELSAEKNISLTFRDPKTGKVYTKNVTLQPPH